MTESTLRVVPLERVVRTRGEDQRGLAWCLNPGAVLAGPDLVESCVNARADLLVTSRLGSFDLTSVAVPAEFNGSSIRHVVAAIGTGPDSALAAEVAFRIGQALPCPVEYVTAVPNTERSRAERTLEALAADRPGTSWRIVSSSNPISVIALTEPDTLVVIGAPRGNWLHRHIFSRGVALRSRAPSGTVMVHSAPRRVFHDADPPLFWVGPHLQLEDAVRVMRDAVAPVVERGFLIGIVRRSATETPGANTVHDVMEDAPLITLTDPAAALNEVAGLFEGSPIPVVDVDGRFVASVAPK